MRKKPEPREPLPEIIGRPDRKLRNPLPSLADRQALAARIKYHPSAKHKTNPGAYKLQPYQGKGPERTYCDAHSKFSKADSLRIDTLLERAALSGCWNIDVRGDVPSMLWTVDDTGWVYELFITNQEQADYHGYPVMPVDGFARLVVGRMRAWYDGLDPVKKADHSELATGLNLAQTKYAGK